MDEKYNGECYVSMQCLIYWSFIIHVSSIYRFMCVQGGVRVHMRFPSEHLPRAASSARGAPAAPSGRCPCDSRSERHILGKGRKANL